MRKRVVCLVVLLSMLIGCIMPSSVDVLAKSEKQEGYLWVASAETDNPEAIDVTGHWWGDDKKTVDLFYNAKYRDDYFVKDSTVVQGGLAKLSMLAAATAYDESNALSFLKQCGFKCTYNSVKVTRKDNDHVSYAIGYKNVDDYTIIAVLVKGTSGNYEWVSNFNLGTSPNHVGFNTAKNEMKSSIKKYLKKNKKKMKAQKKWWITGHSRGAAVANMYAKDQTLSFGQKNVYAYTYATPRVSTNAFKKGFKNIINFLNPGDFVTEVAPSKWKYKRWGVDKVLKKNKSKMKKLFKSLTGTSYGGFGEDGKKSLLGAFLNYCGNKVTKYYKNRIVKYNGNFIVVEKPVDFCQKGLGYILAGEGRGYLYALGIASHDKAAAKVLAKMVYDGKISDKFAHAHCQASYISWLDAIYPETDSDSGDESVTEKYIQLGKGAYHIQVSFQMESDECRIESKGAKVSTSGEDKTQATLRPDYNMFKYSSEDYSRMYSSYPLYDAESNGVKAKMNYDFYLDVYEGEVKLYGSTKGTSPEDLYTVTNEPHELYWHRTLNPGNSISFDNPQYGDNPSAYGIRIYAYPNLADWTGECVSIEYWWEKYMGMSRKEEKSNQSGMFWTPLYNCHTNKYTVTTGQVDFYVLYDEAQKLVIM